MVRFEALEPAVDPNNRISFLLDWEITMKCNLDCSYCPVGVDGGHDNSTQHPDFEACVHTIDFMFEYADLYLSQRPRSLKTVILNIYGGESLHHPDIQRIVQACHDRYRKIYSDRWHLTVTTTTNAIVNARKMQSLIPLIDEFTCSYHAENSVKQKQLFKENLLRIRDAGRRLKVVILMHAQADLFEDTKLMIEWCQSNDIRHLPRQLDHDQADQRFNYDSKEIKWFSDFYQNRSHRSTVDIAPVAVGDRFDMAATGRACCGGRQVCLDQNYRERSFFVANKFTDWFCSVNHFFLYIKQITGDIYVNKDCRMNFDRSVGPIGHLSRTHELLAFTRENVVQSSMPVIQCKRSRCWCGLCAPKAKQLETYHSIMEKYSI